MEKLANSNFIQAKLEEMYKDFESRKELSLGFLSNQLFDYSAIFPFFNIHISNIGDPFLAKSTLLNARKMEQEVLDYFSRLWNAKSRIPLTPESYWGYILGMGATEGNMYSLWSAREYFDAKLISGELNHITPRHPILFFSLESHYSMEKCARLLGIATFQETGNKYYPGQCPLTEDGSWLRGVPVDEHGAVEPKLLALLVDFFAEKGHPPIIVLNIGSTFHGAFDSPLLVWQYLSPVLAKHGFCTLTDSDSRPDCWIHIDGALGAVYLPYLEMAFQQKLTPENGPQFDFSLPWVSSIVMSSHKWYGAPFASGIYMSKEKYRMLPATDPEYVNSPDTTLSGSRNGLSALLLWYTITTVTSQMQAETAARCAALAVYAVEQLEAVKTIHPSFQVARGPQSLVVCFTRPQDKIFKRFHLSGSGKLAHIVMMPHVTHSAIDQLAIALTETDAFTD
ncbi:pyridoxal-dependent decarboxylase [Pantoea sp.]|uniref:pyridoxal-dependent decarboxylase n=1 Tax=Pantoea sp. TaxID=69393 RepID=UPI0028B11700|nr:pyridoxal-dependent decarboxylase [Pantoea sp.]